jgi:hypothetical protein
MRRSSSSCPTRRRRTTPHCSPETAPAFEALSSDCGQGCFGRTRNGEQQSVPTPQATSGRARPPCRHFKTQSGSWQCATHHVLVALRALLVELALQLRVPQPRPLPARTQPPLSTGKGAGVPLEVGAVLNEYTGEDWKPLGECAAARQRGSGLGVTGSYRAACAHSAARSCVRGWRWSASPAAPLLLNSEQSSTNASSVPSSTAAQLDRCSGSGAPCEKNRRCPLRVSVPAED